MGVLFIRKKQQQRSEISHNGQKSRKEGGVKGEGASIAYSSSHPTCSNNSGIVTFSIEQK